MSEEEQAARQEIVKLMEQVAEQAKQHDISFMAVFEFDPKGFFMTTYSHLTDNCCSELHEIGYIAGVYSYD